MRNVYYGDQAIAYTVVDCPGSKAHYISVSRDEGVVLKGPCISDVQADYFVLKKARWILSKLELVRAVDSEAIVTGSRIAYLGKHYYTELIDNPTLTTIQIDFNQSRFRIQINPNVDRQPEIQSALASFFRARAHEKLTTRVHQWAVKTGLEYQELKLRQMSKRWGSCTSTDAIILNPNLIKLPYPLIDYVIIHELCHTRVKNHSKEFWAELSRHMPNWKELDARISRYRI